VDALRPRGAGAALPSRDRSDSQELVDSTVLLSTSACSALVVRLLLYLYSHNLARRGCQGGTVYADIRLPEIANFEVYCTRARNVRARRRHGAPPGAAAAKHPVPPCCTPCSPAFCS
jgi:hypothetical protein